MKVLLIDGNNLIHRGSAAGVMSHEGQRTEIIFLGLSMVVNYLREFEPSRACMVWDGGRDERRLNICAEYKAQRKPPQTEVEKKEKEIFWAQADKLKNCYKELGVIQYEFDGREADDYIYSIIKLANKLTDKGTFEFTVVSSDKDFYQLLGLFDNVEIYSPIKKELYTKESFIEEFGFDVKYYMDWKAMVGDPSDNLAGVKGIGPVGANMIVDKVFISPDGVHDISLSEKEQKYADLLLANFDEFERMKKVIEFYELGIGEVGLGKWEELIMTQNDLIEKAMVILNRYGFERWLENFQYFIGPFEALLRKRHNESI